MSNINENANVERIRKELQTLASLEGLELGVLTSQARKHRMLALAYELATELSK